MPFCNWCQLESESADSCDWCKRPIVRNVAVYSAYGDSVALLREDTGDSADRATVIVGALVAAGFFALVVYAAVSFGGAKPQRSSDPLNSIAQAERTWTGTRPSPPVSAPSVTRSVAAPPTPVSSPTQRISNPRSSPTAQAAPSAGQAGPAKSVSIAATPAGFSARDGEVAPNGVFIESAKLTSTRQQNGDYTIEGTIMVGNVSGHRAFDIEFFLVVGERRVRLKCSSADLGHGISVGFHVKAIDVPTDLAQAADAFVHIYANTDAGKVADSLSLGG